MRAGALRERITLQREVKKTTATNQQIGEWEDVCEIWAEKRCTASAVIDGDGFVVHAATYNFYIRRRGDITATMRVKWKDPFSKKDRFFYLQGPPIDWKDEPNGLTLITKELV